MTKRKPSRRRGGAKRTSLSIGPLWWGIGILSLGWIAFDANRATVADHAPRLAALVGAAGPERVAPAVRRAEPETPRRAAAAPPTSTRPAASQRPAERSGTRVAAVQRTAPPAEIVPQRRPAPVRTATATSRPTPLRREPAASAPVWTTLDAGKPVRVTARQGGWRRVESGIFTGWVEAEFVETPAAAQTVERQSAAAQPTTAMPPRPATANAPRARPAPPGAIPQ